MSRRSALVKSPCRRLSDLAPVAGAPEGELALEAEAGGVGEAAARGGEFDAGRVAEFQVFHGGLETGRR